MVSRANLAGTKAVPRFTQALLEEHHEGLIALSGCRDGELARRLRAGDREGARATAERYAALFGVGDTASSSGFVLELGHRLLPDDDWLASETARLADELGLPVVVTNDVHYARPEGRELQDVLTAIRHGRSLGELADLRRPDGESFLKGAAELLAMPPGDPATAAADPVLARRWREGIAASAEIAAGCRVELAFEKYRFPGFPVPKGQTPFSHLSELCWEGARRRYHPLTPAVVAQLAHELEVISKTGLAEFFLICWDLMRFAKGRKIPAQGRGSAADSIVAYVLGITRVDPIRHELLFERFINEGRTAYPDVDIDFSSERREEVIQYVYERYGAEHTGMVCNLVTYRARSAVREVGSALGFPRPLVDRVAKALETYDSVMVRRDLEAEGGFAGFFARPGEAAAETIGADAVRGARRLVAEVAVAGTASLAGERGLTDAMGQLNHARGGRWRPGEDEGGPGDSPTSVRWIQEGPRRCRSRRARRASSPGGSIPARASCSPRSDGGTPARPPTSRSVACPRSTGHRRAHRCRGRPRRPGRRERGSPPLGPRGRRATGPRPEAVAATKDRSSSVARLAPVADAAAGRRGTARGLRRGPLGLGALAGAVRPHRRLPAPPLDPLGRDARDRGAAHRHRAARARDDARTASSSSTTSATSRR